jgi:hypothetical protein
MGKYRQINGLAIDPSHGQVIYKLLTNHRQVIAKSWTIQGKIKAKSWVCHNREKSWPSNGIAIHQSHIKAIHPRHGKVRAMS